MLAVWPLTHPLGRARMGAALGEPGTRKGPRTATPLREQLWRRSWRGRRGRGRSGSRSLGRYGRYDQLRSEEGGWATTRATRRTR
eukprot:5539485-Alexandrium_andersonii.AAC.1